MARDQGARQLPLGVNDRSPGSLEIRSVGPTGPKLLTFAQEGAEPLLKRLDR
jgi:hypothetical protein